MPVLGKATIEMVIQRAKLVKIANAIVVCTTGRSVDDEIANIANKCCVECYCGNLDDKLERWMGAVRQFDIDFFVTMDGDDLLCDPELMELGLKQMANSNLDFIEAPDGLICGAFTFVIKREALQKICEIKGTDDTEMMWTYFKDTGLFKTGQLFGVERIFFDRNIRLTLDYQEDFDFFNAIFTAFNCGLNNVSLREIVPFLHAHPELIAINAFRHKDWAEGQRKKTKLVLKNG
jgi:spore coat polysaccharide biosynthesis protein SpsF